MAANRYILRLYPATPDTWNMYEEKFHELFKRTSMQSNGTLVFYRDNTDNAGVDLYYAGDTWSFQPSEGRVLDMGVKASMMRINPLMADAFVHYWMPPRSSIWKNGVTLANSIGVIDRTYRGNLMAAVHAFRASEIERGTRIVQVVAPDMGNITEVHLCPVGLIDNTERGEGGFGSTGR